jgi:hypothetical protein
MLDASGMRQHDAGVAVAALPQLVHCSWSHNHEASAYVLRYRRFEGQQDSEQKSKDAV